MIHIKIYKFLPPQSCFQLDKAKGIIFLIKNNFLAVKRGCYLDWTGKDTFLQLIDGELTQKFKIKNSSYSFCPLNGISYFDYGKIGTKTNQNQATL